VNVRAAVQKMEAELALAEAALFKCVLLCAWRRLAGTDALTQATTSRSVFQFFLRLRHALCNNKRCEAVGWLKPGAPPAGFRTACTSPCCAARIGFERPPKFARECVYVRSVL
jgi:hypothetical protein